MIFETGIYFLFDPLKWKKKPWEKYLREIFPYICAIQLRTSVNYDKAIYDIGVKLKQKINKTKIKLIINNRADIAQAVNADGVHLGEKDLPVEEVRKYFRGIIGASRHTIKGAKQAEEKGARYIGCGPVFKPISKKVDRKEIGIKGYLKVKRSVKIPVFPIGGINTKNISNLEGLTDIAAVSSAINSSENPIKTCQKIYTFLGQNK
ncbi:MAG: thiamine phosphate synthase [Elusimicrobiota bacterium]